MTTYESYILHADSRQAGSIGCHLTQQSPHSLVIRAQKAEYNLQSRPGQRLSQAAHGCRQHGRPETLQLLDRLVRLTDFIQQALYRRRHLALMFGSRDREVWSRDREAALTY